jgi:hypothetical protein
MIGLANGYVATVIEAIFVGIIATLATDIWPRVLQAATRLPPANWGLVGRWVAWLPRGKFFHRPIAATPPVRGERAIGWAFHYGIGIAYAALYLAIMRVGFGSEPTFTSALIFALVLLVAPWFVMQPALGLGVMASRAPRPAVVRTVNVSVHAIFGVGLYLGVVAWRAVPA